MKMANGLSGSQVHSAPSPQDGQGSRERIVACFHVSEHVTHAMEAFRTEPTLFECQECAIGFWYGRIDMFPIRSRFIQTECEAQNAGMDIRYFLTIGRWR